MANLYRASSITLFVSTSFFLVAACATQSGPIHIQGLQNWQADEINDWREGSQGSRLIPERWLHALEAPGSRILFMDPAFFDRFNYPRVEGQRVPIGFARDIQDDRKLPRTNMHWFDGQKPNEPWVGLNCAACHTAVIHVNGKDQFIEGAPTMADFQGFTAALLKAMQETRDQPDRWDRFAARALAPYFEGDLSRDTPANRDALKSAFGRLLEMHEEQAALNGTSSSYGMGRLDAVGHILNKVAYLNEAGAQQIGGPPDAPVSYPHIWNAPQHDLLQWNGIVPNDKIVFQGRDVDTGALVRNTSEVIGVFADVGVKSGAGLKGYRSSVNVRNLMAMELQLARLASPAWNDFFEKPKDNEVELGRRLFDRDCASCHAPLARNDLKTPIRAVMTPIFRSGGVGTDKWMACNALTYEALGGKLTGNPARVLEALSKVKQPDGTKKVSLLKERDWTRTYLQNQAVGTILGKKRTTILTALQIWFGRPPKIEVPRPAPPPGPGEMVVPEPQKDKAFRAQLCREIEASATSDARLAAYKGRPLNGIWATGPYLHNGSVRTLYQLLLHPSERETEFYVGGRDFDAQQVGFANVPGRFPQKFIASKDSAEDGNSNEGHFYRSYQPEERWALVAYMKTL